MKKKLEMSVPTSCLNKAGDDETIVVLRGKDRAASKAISAWVSERINSGMNAAYDAQIVEAVLCAAQMETEAKAAEPPKVLTVRLRQFLTCHNGLYAIVWASDVPGGYTHVWDMDGAFQVTVFEANKCRAT